MPSGVTATPPWIFYPDWFPQALIVAIVGLQCLFIVGHAVRPKYRRLHGWWSPLVALRNSLPALPLQLFLWMSLIALLAPWWWLSVLTVHLVEQHVSADFGVYWSPTTVFLSSLGLFYVVWVLRHVLGLRANRKFEHLRESDELSPGVVKRVAVIGAGMAGLVAAKELREEGHEVVIFERTEGWGGVWASSKQRGGTAWATTMTSTGALNSTFSDCPTEVYHPENGDTPLHYTREQFLDMLADYEKRYQVFSDCLRCETEVVGMDSLPEGRWRLRIANRASGREYREEFDAVTLCTGLNTKPWRPIIDGQGSFEGDEIHVAEYDHRNAQVYAGQRVLIVGTGETAADLATELAEHGAKHVFVSQRGATLTLTRNYTTVPPDYIENRLTYSGPMFHRWGVLFGGIAMMLTPLVWPTRVRLPRARYWFQLMRHQHPLRNFPSVFGSINTTKSDNLWLALDAGTASLVPEVTQVNAAGAVAGDKQLDVDTIIYCTGYRPGNAFLPEALHPAASHRAPSRPSARDLYKLTIHPDHPTVAMIGFARGLIGAITISSEMQSRWWALIVSGKRSLPDPREMRRHVAYMRRKGRRFGQPTRTTMTFANSMARHDVGCEPDMFKLFFRDPKLWWRVWNGTLCNAHYRLFGVHAKPDLARRQLLMPHAFSDPNYIDSIDLSYNAIPLSCLLIPLWSAVSVLLPTFSTRGALSSYL